MPHTVEASGRASVSDSLRIERPAACSSRRRYPNVASTRPTMPQGLDRAFADLAQRVGRCCRANRSWLGLASLSFEELSLPAWRDMHLDRLGLCSVLRRHTFQR